MLVTALLWGALGLGSVDAACGRCAGRPPATELWLAQIEPPYRYRTSPDRQWAIHPARPYVHYRPRVRVPGAPETRIERPPPSYMLSRPAPASRAGRAPRTECRVLSRPTSPGSSVRIYGTSRDCD